MCDETKYHELDKRVDGLEQRLTKVETALADMRTECRTGFSDLKAELVRIYDERSKWGAWARDNIGRALKWIGWIVLAACGITQSTSLIKLFMNTNN